MWEMCNNLYKQFIKIVERASWQPRMTTRQALISQYRKLDFKRTFSGNSTNFCVSVLKTTARYLLYEAK